MRNAQNTRIVEASARSRENPETLIVNATVGLEDEIRGGGGGGGLHAPNLKRTIQRERVRILLHPLILHL